MDPQDDQQAAQTGTTTSRIPAEVAQKYPNLEALILKTESMTQEERDYWFQILPIMTDEQIQKLLGILVHEEEQLAKLDDQYESELSKLNDKHLLEWKEEEAREQREAREKAEQAAEAEEQAAEADLLGQLDQL